MKRLFLTGVAALFLATGTAHATVLPDTMTGKWCFVSGDYSSGKPSIFERLEPGKKDCALAEGGGVLFQDSVEDARQKCEFDKIEQISPTTYQVHAICKSNGGVKGWYFEYKLEDNRLIMNVLTEG